MSASRHRTIGLLGPAKIALPIAGKHPVEGFLYPLKVVAAGDVLAAENRVNGFRLGFPFHRDEIELKHRKLRFARRFAVFEPMMMGTP